MKCLHCGQEKQVACFLEARVARCIQCTGVQARMTRLKSLPKRTARQPVEEYLSQAAKAFRKGPGGPKYVYLTTKEFLNWVRPLRELKSITYTECLKESEKSA